MPEDIFQAERIDKLSRLITRKVVLEDGSGSDVCRIVYCFGAHFLPESKQASSRSNELTNCMEVTYEGVQKGESPKDIPRPVN